MRAPLPMSATATSLADISQYYASGWAAEEKFDGCRAMLVIGAASSAFVNDTANRSPSFPDLAAVSGTATGLDGTILDGEFQAVALEGEAYAAFGDTSGWFNSGPRRARMLRTFYRRAPHFRVFDVLADRGTPVTGRGYDERRAILEDAVARITRAHPDCGVELVPQHEASAGTLDAILARGGEGVVLKSRAGRYLPGKRSDAWRKFKAVATVDVWLTGEWRPGQGSRTGTAGSVGVAVTEDDGTARLLGYVAVKPALAASYARPEQLAGTVWEVAANGLFGSALRHPRYLRARPDRDAASCGTSQLNALPVLEEEEK